LLTGIKWSGVAYLLYLAAHMLRSAVRGRYDLDVDGAPSVGGPRPAWLGWRQGFTSNITNPKVLAFYLAVLLQFIPEGTAPIQAAGLALLHAAISAVYLMLVTMTAHAARRVLARRRVRRSVDAITGTAMLGFGARLALEKT
jgi:threonine/homoserine/homoserine lactone efflux protein